MSQRDVPLQYQQGKGETVVQWPQAVVSGTTSDGDLGPPLAQLLIDLDVKGSESDRKTASSVPAAFKGVPTGIAIIEAGATAASKGWAAAIAALGGGTAAWAAISDFWDSAGETRGALVTAAAVVIAACALGAALIMYGDVQARGRGAAAQYAARAAVAVAFLKEARGASQPAPAAVPVTPIVLFPPEAVPGIAQAPAAAIPSDQLLPALTEFVHRWLESRRPPKRGDDPT